MGRGWQQIADNNRAIFSLTLPAGSYTLRAESKGGLNLSQESEEFTVGSGEGELAFTEESYEMKTGDLFDVTVTVGGGDDETVVLKLLNKDGDEAGKLMQWLDDVDAMKEQAKSKAITAQVEDGEAVFKDLFVVDDGGVAQIQAVLEDEDDGVKAVSELSSTDTPGNSRLSLDCLSVNSSNNNSIERIDLTLEPEPEPSKDQQIITDLYSFNGNTSPDKDYASLIGKHAGGSGLVLSSFNSGFIDESTRCYDYEFAIKLSNEKNEKRAFYLKARGNSSINYCKSSCDD